MSISYIVSDISVDVIIVKHYNTTIREPFEFNGLIYHLRQMVP